MFQAPKYFKKHQQMFRKMSPEQLTLYCQKHPLYSLPAGIRDQRMEEAFDIMADCAKDLPQRDRQILSVYMQETFARGCMDVGPQMLYTIYAPVLTNADFVKAPFQNAVDEFLGFARTPMIKERHTLLKQFVANMAKPNPTLDIGKGREAYDQLTRVLPRENIIVL